MHCNVLQILDTLPTPAITPMPILDKLPIHLDYTIAVPQNTALTSGTSDTPLYICLTFIKTWTASIGSGLAHIVPIGGKSNVNPTPIGGQSRS